MGARWGLGPAVALLVAGCLDTEARQEKLRNEAAQAQLIAARDALRRGAHGEAVAALHQAVTLRPLDPEPHLLLAEVHLQRNNPSAALLELQEAERLIGSNDYGLKRRRAELLLRIGQQKAAALTLRELRDAGQLSDAELRDLARLQMRGGDPDGAFATLDGIYHRHPDDLETKCVEAEVLLGSGEELLAVRLMDRLERRAPKAVSVRLLRARYHLNTGRPELAQEELAALRESVRGEDAVLFYQALVLGRLGKADAAVKLLDPLATRAPPQPEVLALMGELELERGDLAAARRWVDQALALKPDVARALYVRGRMLELSGKLLQAMETYTYATRSGTDTGLVLSRMWRIHRKRGDLIEAMSVLERLLFTSEASLEEKVALADLYAQTGSNLTRGADLIQEALRRDPTNRRYRAIAGRLRRARH